MKQRHKNYIHDPEWRRIHIHRMTDSEILEDIKGAKLEYLEPIWGKGIALQFWLSNDCGCILEFTKGRDGVKMGYVPFFVGQIERERENYRKYLADKTSQRWSRKSGRVYNPATLTKTRDRENI